MDISAWYKEIEKLKLDYQTILGTVSYTETEKEIETFLQIRSLKSMLKIYQLRTSLIEPKKKYIELLDNVYKKQVAFEKELRECIEEDEEFDKITGVQIEKISKGFEYLNSFINNRINRIELLLFNSNLVVEKINTRKAQRYFLLGVILGLVFGILSSGSVSYFFYTKSQTDSEKNYGTLLEKTDSIKYLFEKQFVNFQSTKHNVIIDSKKDSSLFTIKKNN